jgi:glycosyltransferase involved in cell wall biosynthesis
MALRVTHLVVTKSFAGVERYITYVAPRLAAAGVDVTVLGGEEARMRGALHGTAVSWHPAGNAAHAMVSLRRHGGGVVHAHMTTAELVAALGGRPSSPIVATRHFAGPRGTGRLARAAGSLAARRIHAQISISEYVAERIQQPSRVIYSAVPDAAEGAHDRRVVIVAQRFESEKETDIALRAWHASGLGLEGWRLELAGAGALRESLERLAIELGLGDTAVFVGQVDDLQDRMAHASILLAPTAVEAFGITVAEAMACGLPIVAAAAGAHLETVGPAAPESMFPPGDAAAAGERLRVLAHDPERRRTEGRVLRAHQQAEFGIDRHVDRLLALYAEVDARSQ